MFGELAPKLRGRTNMFAPLFTSSSQTLVAGGLLTLPHGLGRIPYIVNARFVWTANDSNSEYVIGDTVFLPVQANTYFTGDTEYSVGCITRVDSTNIYFQVSSSGIVVPHRTGGAEVYITLTDGHAIVFAW